MKYFNWTPAMCADTATSCSASKTPDPPGDSATSPFSFTPKNCRTDDCTGAPTRREFSVCNAAAVQQLYAGQNPARWAQGESQRCCQTLQLKAGKHCVDRDTDQHRRPMAGVHATALVPGT
jgi:hypothetical protein